MTPPWPGTGRTGGASGNLRQQTSMPPGSGEPKTAAVPPAGNPSCPPATNRAPHRNGSNGSAQHGRCCASSTSRAGRWSGPDDLAAPSRILPLAAHSGHGRLPAMKRMQARRPWGLPEPWCPESGHARFLGGGGAATRRRYPTVAHPAAPEAGHKRAVRLHLPGPQGREIGHGQGEGDLPPGRQPAAGSPAAPAQPGAAGLDRLLPAGSVLGDVQLPARLHLAAGHRLDTPQAPPDELEGTPPPLLRRRLVALRRGGRAVQPRNGTHDTVPLPGRGDQTGTSGAGDGPGKRAGREPGTAPWADPTPP